MVDAVDDVPAVEVERRKQRIALNLGVDERGNQSLGTGQRFGIGPRAADHVAVSVSRPAQCRIEVGRHGDSPGDGESTSGQDDVVTAGQWPVHALEGSPPHDDGAAKGGVPEVRHLIREVPGQRAAVADHAVPGHRPDQRDALGHGARRVCRKLRCRNNNATPPTIMGRDSSCPSVIQAKATNPFSGSGSRANSVSNRKPP